MNSRLSSICSASLPRCSAYTTALLFFMQVKRTLKALYTIPEDEHENEAEDEVNPYPQDPVAWIQELHIRVLVYFPERLPEFWPVLQQLRNRTSATADCIGKAGTRAGFLATAGWTWSYDGPHVNWTPPAPLLRRLESLDQRCDCDIYLPELCEPDSCGRGWDAQTAGETFPLVAASCLSVGQTRCTVCGAIPTVRGVRRFLDDAVSREEAACVRRFQLRFLDALLLAADG